VRNSKEPLSIDFLCEKYNTFIFDFDGVILNSNNIKKNAIGKAVEGLLPNKDASKFVNYFVGLNGIPREVKIAKYFLKEQYQYVLNKYESILDSQLKSAELILGVKDVIQTLSSFKKNMIVLSGGTESEVLELLTDKGLAENFDGVYGGPKNKEENLQKLSLKYPVLYFGDSEIDYIVSKNNRFDFVFVYGASNIADWRSKTKDWEMVQSISNFNIKG
jgi:phosphoglycolate phosphatase-like HAD superfamily hydrolase